MIRFICIAVFVVLFLICSIPLFFIEWIIGKFDQSKKDVSSLRIVQWAFKVIIAMTGVKLDVIGEENIPDEAALFIGNHRSYFDIVINYARSRRLTGFIAKKEMEKIPLLSVWMKYLHCLFLDRTNARAGLKTIMTAIEKIKSGISIWIFPEGTRNKGEELSMLDFKDGAFKIATKTGCPIVPVSINNMADIFEAHMPFVHKTHVIIEYGKPIYPNELDAETKKHIGDYVQNIIQETINKNAAFV